MRYIYLILAILLITACNKETKEYNEEKKCWQCYVYENYTDQKSGSHKNDTTKNTPLCNVTESDIRQAESVGSGPFIDTAAGKIDGYSRFACAEIK